MEILISYDGHPDERNVSRFTDTPDQHDLGGCGGENT